MPELFMELRLEEVPARMQRKAAEDLKRLLSEAFQEADLECSGVTPFVTPCRLGVVVEGLVAAQPDRREERRGPRVGAPEKAVEGFLKSTGLTLEECEKRQLPKGKFYFAVTERAGRPTADVLPQLLVDVILKLPWPKSMRWSSTTLRFVRPLHGIVAIFDGKVLTGGLDLGRDGAAPGYRESGDGEEFRPYTDATRGHRFLAPDPIRVEDYATYRAHMLAARVCIDREERKSTIRSRAQELAAAEGLVLKEDEPLVEECAGLVEWPVVLTGQIDPEFMDVPPEVLTTAMRSHQKYFSLLDGDGGLAPRFVVVANMEAPDGGREIVTGNERVLRARLSDAKFFWDQDRKKPLGERVGNLAEIVFQARLGTVAEKVGRLEKLAEVLAAESYVPGADPAECSRAARLAKADLTTDMVGEFPELQGIMGQYYAKHDGEPEAVAAAVAEHYSPQGPGDRCPQAPTSVVVSLADKLDSLVGFFAIEERPTGSKDPYALRRAALGVIRLIVENELRVPLRPVITAALAGYPPELAQQVGSDLLGDQLLEFFADRLKVHLKERGVRHDLINAVFALGGEDDLVRLLARVAALEKFLATDDGANLLVAYRRASNIVRIEEKKDSTRYDGAAAEELLVQAEEKDLHGSLREVRAASEGSLAEERYGEVMTSLAQLRRPVDAFFDEVTVNCDDAEQRKNRLRVLAQIRETMGAVADFSKIDG